MTYITFKKDKCHDKRNVAEERSWSVETGGGVAIFNGVLRAGLGEAEKVRLTKGIDHTGLCRPL